MKNSPKVRLESLTRLQPITEKQIRVVEEYKKGSNLVLSGSAGTGKTFMALSLALEDVLDKNTRYDRVVIVRSIVPTRDIGFLPGDEEEKKEAYAAPYRSLITEICSNDKEAWSKLLASDELEFMSTSFIRGITISNAIIVVDEMQNLNYHELCSVMTRIGEHCKIIFCGDYYQSDFNKKQEQDGILKFLKIMEIMSNITIIEFTWQDIVRSGIVREFIMTQEMVERGVCS